MKNTIKKANNQRIQFVFSYRNFKYCTVDNSSYKWQTKSKKQITLPFVYIVLYYKTIKTQNEISQLYNNCALAAMET